ncbi:MAG: PEP-CTERM sorting domain-containing protein [Phycisphaerae bacterium]|jgi:hypothetical protein
MRINKTIAAVFFMLCCLIFSQQAQCVIITPSNVVLPASAGDIFSFDFVISDATSTNAIGFQTTINVSGPGTLTLNVTNSEAVATMAGYWAIGNSADATSIGSNPYTFGDNTANSLSEPLYNDDIIARYAFVWDGTNGDYTFVLNLDTLYSFVQNEGYAKEILGFNPGAYPGTSNSFTISVPEPCTLIIFAFGSGAVLLKRRGR